MSENNFQLVAEALQERLKGSGVATIHLGPLDRPGALDADLVLFLYRVSVNAELRNAGHRIMPSDPDDPIIFHPKAIPFDLHFLLTANPGNGGDSVDNLRQLGQAVQALNDAPDLFGPHFRSDVIRLSFEVMSTEEMGRIWALFPAANYRTSVVILATPVWVDPAPPYARGAHPVVSEEYRANLPELHNGF